MQVTERVVVAFIKVAKRPVLPKSSVAALTVQLAVTVSCTVILAVVVAACAGELMDNPKAKAAEKIVSTRALGCRPRKKLSDLAGWLLKIVTMSN